MKGYVKCTVEDFAGMVTDLAILEEKVSRLEKMKRDIESLIEDVKFVKMESVDKYTEPMFLSISEVAFVLGIDWENELRSWREVHAQYLRTLEEVEEENKKND